MSYTQRQCPQVGTATPSRCFHLFNFYHSKGPYSSQHTACLICHESLGPTGDNLVHRDGKCRSCYHEKCLTKWLAGNDDKCPNCAAVIRKNKDPAMIDWEEIYGRALLETTA